MSANLPQFPSDADALLPAQSAPAPLRQYEPDAYTGGPYAGGAGEEAGGFSLARFALALHRYRWLIVLTTIVGTAAGFAATRFIEPEFVVQSTVFATPTSRTSGGRGLSDGALTQNAGWRDLIQSFAIIDPVMRDLALYLQPKDAADLPLFAGFRITDKPGASFVPGDYTFKTENGRYTLTDKFGTISEVGTVGDSVGRRAGFVWVPPARLIGTKARTIAFKVLTPREASLSIRSRLNVVTNETSPVIFLQLRGTAAQKPAATLNAMMAQFVTVAGDLKQRELVQQATALGSQLDVAQQRLRDTERQLENYRVTTISKPSEGGVVKIPNLGGTGAGTSSIELNQPVLNTYQINKYQYESLQRDRRNFADLADALGRKAPGTTPEVLLNVGMVASDPSAEPLRATIKELGEEQTKLRKLQMGFKDSLPEIQAQMRVVAELRDRVLPQRIAAFADIMRERERTVGAQVADATTELREIPTRTTQQSALQRELGVATETYTKLRLSYADANLARQSAIADVKVLDPAVTPLDPTSNTTPKLIGAGILGGLALGVVLAFLLDRLDSRFRYPDQVRTELGLDVLGAVPRVNQERQSPEAVAQIVEAFRAIRMNVRYAAANQRAITFGITSPGPGDGKSLIASNLALSFAEGGWRTVVIDADTRRGHLNTTFDVTAKPGLVDYLEGSSLLTEVLYPTRHDNLTIVPCGTRHRRAPELLTTPRMKQLLAALANEFDVIIIDTPPLGAGTDAYAIGTACGQLALVLRHNRTNIKMAKAKLGVVSHLPITLMGAILNEVQTDSMMYQYYSYDPDYVMAEDAPALTAGSERGGAVAVHGDD